MKFLRKDLLFHYDEKLQMYVTRVPMSDEQYAFTESELYLIENISQKYQKLVLITKHNSRFHSNLSISEFDEFLNILEKKNMLTEHEDESVTASFNSQSQTSDSMESDVTLEETAYSNNPHKSGKKNYNHWSLFNPEPIFDSLLKIIYPFRFFLYLLPIFVVIGVLAFIFNFNLYLSDLKSVKLHFNLFQHLLFSMFTINLLTQSVRGLSARLYNIPVPSFGIIFVFGLLPRFNVFIDRHHDMPLNSNLVIISSSLIARFILFSLGISLWLISRGSGTLLPLLGSMLSLSSLVSFFIVANPLMRSDGYRLLAHYFQMPNLRQRANKAFISLFKKQPEVIEQYTGNKLALRIYALASIIFMIALGTFISFVLSNWLLTNYHGFGIVIFLLILFLAVLSLYRKKRTRKKLKAEKKSIEPLRNNPAIEPIVRTSKLANHQADFIDEKKKSYSLLPILLPLLLLCLLLLPFKYEPGGSAEIFPISSHEIYAETSGVVEHIYANTGDWVNKGEIISQLSNFKEKRDILTTEAAIQKKQEEIETLLSTPRKETIDYAKEKIKIAQLQYKYSIDNVNRLKTLYETKYVSLVEMTTAQEKMELGKLNVSELKLSLADIQNQVNSHQINAIKEEQNQLRKELDYYHELYDRTYLKMPVKAMIVTENIMNLKNKYLEAGDLFTVIEDNLKIQLIISVPEADIADVIIGSKVNLKLMAYTNKSFEGVVSQIYPQTSDATFGKVVKVIAIIPNDQHLIKSGMTGYAKIEGKEVTVAYAFTKALVNFFTIEVWSWFP